MSKHKKTQAAAAIITLLSFVSAAWLPVAQAEAPSAVTEAPIPRDSEEQAAEDPRETYVLLAVLCFNEASGNENDCRAIGNIRARYARSQEITLREALLRLHSERRPRAPEAAALRSDRATNPRPRDARAWLGDVRADLHQPLGWRLSAQEWERTARVFESLFHVARAVEAGNSGDPCHGAPIGWGGPVVDHARLQRLAEYGLEQVTCTGTANRYYARVR